MTWLFWGEAASSSVWRRCSKLVSQRKPLGLARSQRSAAAAAAAAAATTKKGVFVRDPWGDRCLRPASTAW